jgi:hypothetical protein
MFHDRIAPVVDRLLRALAAAQLIITMPILLRHRSTTQPI